MDNEIDEFEKIYGREFTDELFLEAMDCISKGTGKGSKRVSVYGSHEINRLNHVYTGCVLIGDPEDVWEFAIECGNNNGTEILQWCREEDAKTYEPPKPTRYYLVPEDDSLKRCNPSAWRNFLQKRKLPQFKELESAYNYDRHFAPGLSTARHYQNKASQYKLQFVDEEAARDLLGKHF